MNDKLLSFVGLCRLARRLVIGAQSCEKSLSAGKSKLIIYASDISTSSLKPVLSAAERLGVESLDIGRSKEELSLALGKLCGVASVEDDGFAVKLRSMCMNEKGGELYDKI
jgi:ribosomal protein L7Ae-like RNA K-turn-binding protein